MKATAFLGICAATLLLAFSAFMPALGQDEDPEKTLEKKLEQTDVTDPDQLYDVALWAMKCRKSSKVRKEGRKLMREVLDLDEDHEPARTALGFKLFEGKWYTKSAYRKAKRKAMQAKMKEKGYVFFRNGWIKATEKRDWNNKWEKDEDDVWVPYEEMQRRRGLTLYDDVWLKLDDDDRKAMDYHRKMTGDDILVTSTPHFRLHLGIPAKDAQHFADLVEQVYDWYVETFQVPDQRRDNLYQKKAHIWSFETVQEYQDWITTYSEFYQFTDEEKKRFRERPGGRLLPSKRIIAAVAKKVEDLENPLIHQVGMLSMGWHTGGRAAPWLEEAVGHLAEATHSSEKYGRVNCTTNSRYGGSGGIAEKSFNTKDSRPHVKSIVKAGDHRPFDELTKLELNSLNGSDLAQGYSIFEWLYNTRLDQLGGFLNLMARWPVPKKIAGSRPDVYLGAYKAGLRSFAEMSEGTSQEKWENEGWDEATRELEKEWEKYVRKTYR